MMSDKKFAAVFDDTELEVVSFYIFMIPVLK